MNETALAPGQAPSSRLSLSIRYEVPAGDFDLLTCAMRRLAEAQMKSLDYEMYNDFTQWAVRGPWRSWG
jgi:hypothetical protein